MNQSQTDIREELCRKLTAKPFQPFEIVTDDGHRFPVTRRFQAAIGETIILVGPPEGDGTKQVKLNAIRSLESSK